MSDMSEIFNAMKEHNKKLKLNEMKNMSHY